MRGVGSARAAVSIVNALATGTGAAFGVELVVRAEVRFGPEAPGDGTTFRPEAAGTPVVRAALAEALARFGEDRRPPSEVEIASEIPVAKGLKSSSAVASAVGGAVAAAAGRTASPVELARLSARAGRLSGASATGAFDDALAGLTAGVVVTDNQTDTVLSAFELPDDLEVVLWIPDGAHPPAPSLRAGFSRHAADARGAVDLVLHGDWAPAMERNSAIVEATVGYDYAALRQGCRQSGALASGVSGLGPAFAAVVPRARVPSVVGAFPAGKGTVRTVHPNRATRPAPEAR